MAFRDKADMDTFHKCIEYAMEKLGKSKSGFEGTVVSKFKSKSRVRSGNELVDYSRAPCLGANQKARGLWERDWESIKTQEKPSQAISPRGPPKRHAQVKTKGALVAFTSGFNS